MKILVVTPRVPFPLDKGDRLRAFHQIRELSQQHEVALFALAVGSVKDGVREQLLRYCSRVEFGRLGKVGAVAQAALAVSEGLPAQVGYFRNRASRQRLALFAKAFAPDVAYFQLARTAPYAAAVECPKVLDYMDCFSDGLAQRRRLTGSRVRSWALGAEQGRMRRYEHDVTELFDAFTAISRRDIENLEVRVDVSLVANGVDLSEYSPVDAGEPCEVAETDLLFVGNLEYPPNVLAIRELVERTLPVVHERRPNTTLRIAGKNPPRWLRQMRSSTIDVCGWREHAAPWYRAAKLFVAPMPVATGVQNKVLQALACGIPCLVTPIAAQPFIDQDAPIVCAEADRFPAEIVALLEDREGRASRGAMSRRFATEQLSWQRATRPLDTLLASIIAETK